MLGILAPQLEGSMAPGEGAEQQSEGTQQEPDPPLWQGSVLLSAVLREEASCVPEASPTGSWTSRPAGPHGELIWYLA